MSSVTVCSDPAIHSRITQVLCPNPLWFNTNDPPIPRRTDFLWFLINPAYGLRGFRKDKIWWHAPTWWWIMPRDYWVFFPLGCVAYGLSSLWAA